MHEQLKPPNLQDFNLQADLINQHHHLLVKDEEFHHQCAKKNWALHGDHNTAYFHQAIVKRTRKNRITYLCNPDGSESTTQEQLSQTLIAYFLTIFSSQLPESHSFSILPVHNFSPDQQTTTAHQAQDQSNRMPSQPQQEQVTSTYTNSKPTIAELHSIIKNMRSNASPRPDGLNAAFYKAA